MSTWTAESLAAYVAATPNMDWSHEGDDVYAQRYIRAVSEFGLELNIAPPTVTPWERFSIDQAPVADIPVAAVTSSTQVEGVCLDIIDHYLVSDEVFDVDGWFGNDVPVVIARNDGTYTVRDGNHRIIAARLNGTEMTKAHVIP